MDVLRPAVIWVDGRCYRVLENTYRSNTQREISPYVEDNEQLDYDSRDEYFDEDIEIVPHGSIKFIHTFRVPQPFFPFIIGSKNVVRKRLETETKTQIQIPQPGHDGDIVIIGTDRKGIMMARHRINLLVEASRKKIPFTHFLSVPLNEGHIIMKFNLFKNEVLTNSGKNDKEVDETLFQIPSRLHLTFGALILLDDVERNTAIEALNYCKENIIKPIIAKRGPISMFIQGTDIMNDDPSETRVLYAKVVDISDGLQEIADQVSDYFNSLGLLRNKTEKVKLHVTLMNVKFKLDREERQNKKKQITFDATEILKAHENTVFGETTLKQIHISQRHTISNNGYYQATAKINLLEDL